MLKLPPNPQFCQTDVSGSTFVNADCFDVFPFIEDKSIDAIIREKVSEVDLKGSYVYETLKGVPKEYWTPEILEFMNNRESIKLASDIEVKRAKIAKDKVDLENDIAKFKELYPLSFV